VEFTTGRVLDIPDTGAESNTEQGGNTPGSEIKSVADNIEDYPVIVNAGKADRVDCVEYKADIKTELVKKEDTFEEIWKEFTDDGSLHDHSFSDMADYNADKDDIIDIQHHKVEFTNEQYKDLDPTVDITYSDG
jgi:hypothetical protein